MPDGWEVNFSLNPLTNDAAADADGDRARNAGEYAADTDPTNSLSFLGFLKIALEAGGTRLDWKGGREAWQFLEIREDLRSVTEPWTAILGLPPPTPLTNAVIDLGATNRMRLYRIRAER
jgi:hypothetical protein